MRDELAKLLICTNSTELAGYFNRLRRSAQKLLATCGAALRFRYWNCFTRLHRLEGQSSGHFLCGYL